MRSPSEKDFYLEDFRGHALLLGVDRDVVATAARRRRRAAVVGELIDGGARVIVVLGAERATDLAQVRAWLGLPAPRRRRTAALPVEKRRRGDVLRWKGGASEMAQAAWAVLRARPLCLIAGRPPALELATALAASLRVHKLVMLAGKGGLADRGGSSVSYIDGERLAVLLQGGEAEFQGLGARRAEIAAIARALEAGVDSANLCRVEDVARELFTYAGAGTFFSLDDHCRIRRLGIDDFPEVERLLLRGQAEGLLKPRTAEEIGEILLDGYGAWIGDRHLAGVAALHRAPYAAWRVAEISGLYGITRFQGEGIGARLVRSLVSEAKREGLRGLFAVTSVEGAATFFLRSGFEETPLDSLPPPKFSRYDESRRARVRAFRVAL